MCVYVQDVIWNFFPSVLYISLLFCLQTMKSEHVMLTNW